MITGLIGVNSVAALAIEIGKINLRIEQIILIDDDLTKHGNEFKGYTINGSLKDIINNKIQLNSFILCFGEQLLQLKKDVFLQLIALGIKPANFIHPSLMKFPSTSIGVGNIFGAGIVIGHDTEIGDDTIIFGGAVIEHNSQVKNHCYIGPNVTVSGYSQIDEGTLIGSGATILPEIKIGKFCKIGAGAVVTKNVGDYTVVAGVPAQILNKH